MEKNYYIENKTLFIIAGVVLCIQGVCGVSLVSTGVGSLGYVVDYYDYMFSSISIVLVGINIICGILILGAYVFAGVTTLCRKMELMRIGIVACGATYVLVAIRDIIGAAYYGVSGTLFVNILCLAMFAVLAVALLTDTVELRQLIVKYNTILWAVPAAILILTLIVSRYNLGSSSVFLTIVETLAQIAAIYISGAIIRWDASGVMPDTDGWTRANVGTSGSGLNENVNFNGGNNHNGNGSAGAGTDTNSAFNVNMSVQPPEGYRSVLLVIVFSIITLGIYVLYWVYKVSQLVNRELRTGKSETAQLLLFMFIPFYSWYWYFKTSENIGRLAAVRGGYRVSSIAGVNLLLVIFGLGIIAQALMQDDINKIVGEYEGDAYKSQTTGYYSYAQPGGTWQKPADAEYETVSNDEAAAAEEKSAGVCGTSDTMAEATSAAPTEAVFAEKITKVSEATVEPKVPYEELKKLKELLDEDIITQEEFEKMKKKFI